VKLEKAGIWFLFHLYTIGSIVSKISTQLKPLLILMIHMGDSSPPIPDRRAARHWNKWTPDPFVIIIFVICFLPSLSGKTFSLMPLGYRSILLLPMMMDWILLNNNEDRQAKWILSLMTAQHKTFI